ncbi:unnamed protein product [Ilex paraguariensis]|uniref:Uncharacterized protein n=1 Tax=Ilex paraguariensis TaxID=185542 RepID=A0ABC8SWE0_9AQUA
MPYSLIQKPTVRPDWNRSKKQSIKHMLKVPYLARLVFGCRHSSAESYIISALIIIAIVIALRIICYTVYRLLKGDDSGSNRSSNDGMEMQPQDQGQLHRSCVRMTLPDCNVVILAGEDHASFMAEPRPFRPIDPEPD